MREIVINYNLAEMSDEEVSKLLVEVQAEATQRERKKQERMWNAVKTAIKEYINEFGEIEVESMDRNYYLSALDDYDTFGTITEKGSW